MRREGGFVLKIISLTACVCLIAVAAAAQPPALTPVPLPPEIDAPRDIPFPGEIKLSVDATDVTRGIFRVRETVPASPGPMTLLYPNWIPGHHAPRGPMEKLAGLVIRANGEQLDWKRDAIDMAAIHVVAPRGAKSLDIEFQYLSPTEPSEGRIEATPEIVNIQWNDVSLYPAGYYASRIPVEASVVLPAGWKYGTALRAKSSRGDETTFGRVSYETLIDSPIFAGRYFRALDLDPGAKAPVVVAIVADEPDFLRITQAGVDAHRELVRQADRLFGARPFDHYDFLVALSDELGPIGLEHHRSSENRVAPKYFADWPRTSSGRDLLAHEYAHSWNGKFRRPADLWTPNFNVPMRDSLLWVYEGQTEYWGFVLAARSGLISAQEALESFALSAAVYTENRGGRAWRDLRDTTNDPVIAARKPLSWRSWQRSEDYYKEGMLIWLDVDTLIRERSGGKKSLDHFARAFFGINDGDWTVVTYEFDDVVETLNGIVKHDWAAFLRARLEARSRNAPLDGLERGGYRLAFSDKPTPTFEADQKRRKIVDLTYSLGVILNLTGDIIEVRWEGPAYNAGLTTAARIIAVNGFSYDVEKIGDAITAAALGAKPIELIVKSGERYRTVSINYRGGLRYPYLQRIEGKPALLDAILTAR